MNIEVRNIILDLKRLGKTSGQISQTLSEVYGYSVTRGDHGHVIRSRQLIYTAGLV